MHRLTLKFNPDSERFRTARLSPYRRLDGVVIAFTFQDRSSFNDLTSWFKELDRYASENTPRLIAGVVDFGIRNVTIEEVKDLADSVGKVSNEK